jgi:NAD-dependent SIR2 family protein deacetylase
LSIAVLVAVLGVGAVVGLVWYPRSDLGTGVNDPIEQPVPYSHALHVGGLGMDCRYCHATVEKSSTADIPSTETCMSCHSQVATDRPTLQLVRDSYQNGQPISWNRVNNVPDFVYFNHEAHVAKGVGCETCHGRVDTMNVVYKAETLHMEWCLQCHRNPADYIRPRANVFDMGYQPQEDQRALGEQLVSEYQIASAAQLTNCSVCHR